MQKRVRVTIKLTSKQQTQLKAIAKTYGIGTIAGLAQFLLVEKLPIEKPTTLPEETNALGVKTRVELQLGADLNQTLKHMANQEGMSLNKFIVLLLHNYAMKEKVISNLQLQTLRNSNFQLFQIGKNINQIAKALNSKQSTYVSTEQLKEIASFIDAHTEKVIDVISQVHSI